MTRKTKLQTYPPKKRTLIPGADIFFSDEIHISKEEGTQTGSYFTSRKVSDSFLPTGFNRKSSRCWRWKGLYDPHLCFKSPWRKLFVFLLKIFPRPPPLTLHSQSTTLKFQQSNQTLWERKQKVTSPYDFYFSFFKDLYGIQKKDVNKISLVLCV